MTKLHKLKKRLRNFTVVQARIIDALKDTSITLHETQILLLICGNEGLSLDQVIESSSLRSQDVGKALCALAKKELIEHIPARGYIRSVTAPDFLLEM